jgi:hypothetical protein
MPDTIIVLISKGIGMFGYHHFEQMSVVDSFANAAMMPLEMGPPGD